MICVDVSISVRFVSVDEEFARYFCQCFCLFINWTDCSQLSFMSGWNSDEIWHTSERVIVTHTATSSKLFSFVSHFFIRIFNVFFFQRQFRVQYFKHSFIFYEWQTTRVLYSSYKLMNAHNQQPHSFICQFSLSKHKSYFICDTKPIIHSNKNRISYFHSKEIFILVSMLPFIMFNSFDGFAFF